MGQWMYAYENRTDEYDYYIFTEDDYCFLKPNFDKILVDAYRSKFPDGIGLLCSLIEHDPVVHFEGVIFVSRQTMQKLYEFHGRPRECIDTMDKEFHYNRFQYPGGYWQLAFSHMFTMAGIEHKTYTDVFPYWDDNTNSIIMYGEREYNNHLYGPVQMAKPLYASRHTGLKHLIFVTGMHRCGTSLLTSCIAKKGYSMGRSLNQDKNWQNPKGYFENDKFTEFHEKLLKFNGLQWHSLATRGPGGTKWTPEHVNEYRNLIDLEFSKQTAGVIKDPRLTLFEDFLHEVCRGRYLSKIVFCTRDRTECCESLARAQNIPAWRAQEVYDISHQYLSPTMELVDYENVRNNKVKWIDSSELFDPELYRIKNTTK